MSRAVKPLAFMEKDNPQPKTQPSGNKPPPRPPTRTAIGMPPDDEGPEKNRRHIRQETVRINLPPKPFAEPTIRLPLLPTASTSLSKKTRPSWRIAAFLIFAIWVFIGAVVATALQLLFSNNHHWDLLRSTDVALVLFFLWVIYLLNSPLRHWKRSP